jgi:formimidoylglutamate deiminase
MERRLICRHLLTPVGWLSPGYLHIALDGMIVSVSSDRPASWEDQLSETIDGFVLPGLANLHSHTHQRGLSGHAEGWEQGKDQVTFWDWRAKMYAFVNCLSPDDFEAISARAYLEMLQSGFTSVAEFHYLHNAPDGRPYDDPAELSRRVQAAANQTGIGLTLLPSLYMNGGIGKPPFSEQRRFLLDVESFMTLVGQLKQDETSDLPYRVGIAPHSLRAVGRDDLQRVVEYAVLLDPTMPIHIHVAEQQREVEEALAMLDARPIEWLLDNLPVDERWVLVHATHCTPDERMKMVNRGVTVGLCPTTEANLGDGFFPLPEYDQGGGSWGIGTDADLRPSVADELRQIEYAQRLLHQRRDVIHDDSNPHALHPGQLLIERAAKGGATALGQPMGALAPGLRADLIVLDPEHLAMIGHRPETACDGWVFTGGDSVVRDVMVGGSWLIRDRHHVREYEITHRFRRVMKQLWEGQT